MSKLASFFCAYKYIKVPERKEEKMILKKMTLAGIFTAIGVICSAFYIPVGVAKAFPIQSMLNILAAVILGPWYGVLMAFTTSLLRNILSTGSLLAFPGSMCGALLSGIMYKYLRKIQWAVLGEMIGTGFIGSILAYPIAYFLLGSNGTAFVFVIPFLLSAIVGSVFSGVILYTLDKSKILSNLIMDEK